ncbi:hypothetical protein AB0P36_35870, partial [Streptomyces flavidovirens]
SSPSQHARARSRYPDLPGLRLTLADAVDHLAQADPYDVIYSLHGLPYLDPYRALPAKWRTGQRDEHGSDWSEHAWHALENAEAAVLVFRNEALRKRLEESMALIRDADALPADLVRLLDDDPVSVACSDVKGCLGANLRGQPLSGSSRDWTNATKWVRDLEEERERQARHDFWAQHDRERLNELKARKERERDAGSVRGDPRQPPAAE